MALNWWRHLAGLKSSASPRRRTAARPKPCHTLRFERFEDRILLSFGTLPPYDPSQLTQTLFGSDTSMLPVPAGKIGTVSNFYQFALHGQAGTVAAKFDLAPADPASTRDGALALYDSSGNVLMVADADPVPGHPGFESLTATLLARTVYTLGVFFQAGAVADQFNVTATTAPQVAQPTIALDLTTGKAATTVDSFVTPATVNYYPLNLLDAGASGTVTVTPTGLDVNAFATLFRRNTATGPWQPIASGSGSAAFSLPITPPAGMSLTDASYLLAVATRTFSMAARSYTVDVQATGPLLAPASVSLATVTDLLTPSPTAMGTAQVIQLGSLTTGGQPLFRFRAPSAGSATPTLVARGDFGFGIPSFAPVLSVYDAAGARLLAVSSNTANGFITATALSLPVQAGAVYVMRVSAASGPVQSGSFNLSVQTPYTPADLPLNPLTGNSSITTITGITVGPSQGARFYHLNPASGTNVLVIGVAPGNGASPIAAEVVLVAPNLTPVTQQVAAGQTLLLPVDITKVGGPFDLYVAGTTGSDPATLQIGQLHLPTVLDLASLRPVEMALNGQLMAAPDLTQSAGAFGSLGGVQYYQLTTGAGTTTLSVQGSSGAQPLLAHYREDGGVFRLAAFALPAGSQAALGETLTGSQLQGVAAFALGFAGTGMNAFSVTAPKPVGVGDAMVPDLETDTCTRPTPHCSVLHISNVTLAHDYQQDLWQTILPFNSIAVPTVTFQPAGSAPQLQAKVSVYYADGTVINPNETNAPGQPRTFNLNDTVGHLNGKPILFRVEPVRGQPLGSGTYSLTMTVPTDDPTPFLLLDEQTWTFTHFPFPQVGHGIIPVFTSVVDVAQNQYGHGEALGQFTSSQPYYTSPFGDAGALQVFRFWALTPGPVVVKTVLIDSTLHTNLKVYKAAFDSSHAVTSLQTIDQVGPNLNWFPADRSKIDAQTYINDFGLIGYAGNDNPYGGAGGNLYYVVVKNQEGTRGRFKLVVDTAPMPLVGDVSSPSDYYNATSHGKVVYIPPATGGQTVFNAYLGNYPGLVGYFPVQVPANHNGTVVVSSLISQGIFFTGSGYWDFALFDAAGRPLPGTVADGISPLGNVPYTRGTFTVPDGPQMVFLRIRSKANAAVSTSTQLVVSADLKSTPPNTPPATFSGTEFMLPTNPQGDGTLQDTVSAAGDVKAYAFPAAAGPVKVTVAPSSPSDVQLLWGIYVNNKLIGWNQTSADPASTTTTVLLPDLRQPIAAFLSNISSGQDVNQPLPNPDYDYDRAPQDTVVVYIKAITPPRAGSSFTITTQPQAQVPQRNLTTGDPVDAAGDLFTATLDPSAVQPLGGYSLRIDPLTGTTGTQSFSGQGWSLLSVPAGNISPVHLSVSVSGTVGIPRWLRYDLYSRALDAQGHYTGQLITSDTRFNISGIFEIDLPNTVSGGTTYYLRLGNDFDAPATVTVTASADYGFKNFCTGSICLGIPPASGKISDPLDQVSPSPDGHFGIETGSPPYLGRPELLESVLFWVGSGGQSRFDVDVINSPSDPNPNAYVALYRGSVTGTEFPSITLPLVDFVNNANSADGHNYRLDAFLDPGMYVLQVVRKSTAGNARLILNASLPPYIAQEIVIDPNNGGSSEALRAISLTRGPSLGNLPDRSLLDEYRTTFYHVVTPGGNQGGMMAFAKKDTQDLSSDHTLSGAYAAMTLWTQPNANLYTTYAYFFPTQNAQVGVGAAAPGSQFWIGFNRDNLWGKAVITVNFNPPMSGIPDWVVDPIVLKPDNGQTTVQVTVHNRGYGLARSTTAWLQFTDASKPAGQQYLTSMMSEDDLTPFASVTHTFTWHPVTPNDEALYVTNYDQPRNGKPVYTELDVTNNGQTVKLSTVDPASPVVSIHLADPNMVAGGNDNVPVWGRYVAGILGVQTDINLQINSPTIGGKSGGLYQLNIDAPGNGYSYSLNAAGTNIAYALKNFDFGKLAATSPSNPNQLRVIATDQFGLMSDPDAGTKTIQVVPLPNWANGLGNSDPHPLVFDGARHQYNLRYLNSLVNKGGRLDDWLPFQLPLIGDKDNRLLIEITGTATASLAPSGPIVVSVEGHALLKVLGETVFDEHYVFTDAHQITDHLSFQPKLFLNGTSLAAEVFAVSFYLKDVNLYNYKSPKYPLFVLPLVPGVASLQATLQFGIDVTLNAALTVGVNLQTGQFGLLSPTYIEPQIKAWATLAGEIQVVGFDLAELSGTATITVTPRYGLSTPIDQIVPFSDFFDKACFEVQGTLAFNLEADVLGFKVWSWNPQTINFGASIPSTCHVIKGQDNPPPIPPPTIHPGTDPVGPITIDPSPNLVIDPATGNAVYVQVANGASGSGTVGNLAVSQRTNGTWSPLTRLPQTTSASKPVLAFSHDRPGTPAVVVYSAQSTPGDPSGLTENQYLAGQGIRWRYNDGITWGNEQTLMADSRYNFNPALSFNAFGQGVLAWVHDTNPVPVNGAGLFDRTSNQIEAAVWDPVNHAWRTPQALTVASSVCNPAVYAADNGKLYVVWLQDTGSGTQVLYSIFNGDSWSAAAVLPLIGVPAGGMIGEVAIGSERAGRLDVLLTYDRALPDGTADHFLYNRPSTVAGFGMPAAVEVVADSADFSHLRMLQARDGGLIAYWQQSDGITNEIFTSRIGPTTSVWSPPAPLTAGNPMVPGSHQSTGTNIQFAPSVAIDTDGRYQVVYAVNAAPGAATSPPRQDPSVGNPMSGTAGGSSTRMFPELAFSQALLFAYRNPASSGSAVSNGAPSGSTVMAQAEIVNRGLGGDSVRLDFFDGLPGSGGNLLGSQTIYLGPGQTYAINYPFVVGMGSHTYAIRATALGGQEIVPTTHVTSATLVGLIDVAVGQVTLSDPNPHGGQAVTITGDIVNLSNLPVGAFTVAFYLGNPSIPNSATLLGTQPVNGFTANGHQLVSFPWTVPAAGGIFVLTVRADSGMVLQEVTRNNNDGAVALSVLPDAALVPLGLPPVRATLLNYSGVNNVSLSVTVSNLGQADLTNVPVQVLWSLNGGAFQPVASTIIASLPTGQTGARTVVLTVSGLAGHNLYRVVVDPNSTLPDANRANNVAETMLLLQGLPDLGIGALSLVAAPDGLGSLLTAPIRNQGIATVNAVAVEVFAYAAGATVPTASQLNANGTLLAATTIDQLNALSSTAATLHLTTLNLLNLQLCVVVDRANKILMVDHMHNVACTPVPQTPATPTNLTATAISNTQIQLTWANHAISATLIQISRSVQGGPFTLLAGLSATTATYTDSGLAPGTYAYEVRAWNGEGQSGLSNIASAAVPISATHFSISPSSTAPVAGTAFTITVTALTAANQTATSYRGTVHFTSADGQAVLPLDYTFTAADNGIHTLTLTLKTAGSQGVTAQDTVSGSLTGNVTVTVKPAVASLLLVANFPSPVTAGTAGTITVTAKDPYGNVATGYRGTVTFTSSDSQAMRPANYAFTAADNGVHSFSITLKTAGTQSVIATDTGTATLTGTQAGIVVNPAVASLLVVANFPSPTEAGAGQTFTVTAQDAFGNTVIGYTGTVTFTTSDPQGIVPDDYPFTAADHGSHTFGGAMLTVGTQTLTATDSGNLLLNGSQGGIVVTPAPADHFDISTSDSSTAGTAFDVTVTARDPYGNTDTNYQGTVTFTSADSLAALPGDYTFTADDGGVVTFAAGATLFTAGGQDVTATDTTSGISGTAIVTVTPAAADHFSISAPGSVTAGAPFDVTITALDPYGNTDTNYQGTVTFATSDTDPGVVLPADYTFQAGDAGLATFAGGATLVTLGDQTITATDTSSGISGAATVTVGTSGRPQVHFPRSGARLGEFSFPALSSFQASSSRSLNLVRDNAAQSTRMRPASLESASTDRFFAEPSAEPGRLILSRLDQSGLNEWSEEGFLDLALVSR
jgi:hypothetical protein